MEKLVLIDGNSLINRAFYAMPPLSNKDGVFTNAVYGFMNMFFRILSDVSPTYVTVAFDLKAPTFRHKLYKDYKGTRKPMPDELRPQIPLLKELLNLMNINTVEKEGFEADDLIGTIAKNTSIMTYIYTGDKDSLQLVDDETEVHFTKRGITDLEIYTNQNFKEKTGLSPCQIIDLKALMGDSSDNIPGVKGVGEKTAVNLLTLYHTVDRVYQNIDKITGKLKEKLVVDKENAFLSKTLATIDVNSPVQIDFEKMKTPKLFPARAKKKFIELEFKSLASKDMFAQELEEETPVTFSKIQITSLDQLTSVNSDLLSLFIDNNCVFLSDGKTDYCIKYRSSLLDDGFSFGEILLSITPLLQNTKKLIVYNKKELLHLLKPFPTVKLPRNTEDLSIVKYLADFSGREESFEQVIEYYSKDKTAPALSLFLIYFQLYSKLVSLDLEKLYKEVELPLVEVLFEMENAGFRIDYPKLIKTGETFKERLLALEKEIRQVCGEPELNVNSPVQLGTLLFEKLKIGKGKKTKRGYSTSAEVLEGLEGEHPVIKLILNYRKLQKLYSTYVEGFDKLIDKKSGLIKTSFNQTVTSTGRLSSKEPNLQNIPVRDGEGKELRKFFVPKSSDRILISADYSQIELRLLASFSSCAPLIKAFKDGKDVHSDTASKVFGVPLSKVTSEQRSSAKAVNFGIIYGISEYGLAKNIKVSPAKAREYINSYFKQYPEVKKYMEDNVNFTKKTGYAVTVLGRKRYIKEISSSNYNLRTFGERAAMNMPLQGSSADIIKLAMIGVNKRLKKEKLNSELILQVHDELIIDAYKDEAEKVKKILKEEMEGALKLSVELTVGIGEGETWFDAK